VQTERGKTLRLYIKRFFDMRSTIANIADDDASTASTTASPLNNYTATSKEIVFLPRSVMSLRDMMLGWAD